MFFFQSVPTFKNQFRHLIFYSIPHSVLLIVRKRLNFLGIWILIYVWILYAFI